MSSVRWPTGGANWQSQQLSHSDIRTMKGKSGGGKSHSWWWDSHNAPKNSKWLEDNLNDMDSKVKAMLKLIEEDADSFAKRAEMYYKKRPELVSLVEEFYRAYRSLAERYDQLTGHIRQIPQEIQAHFGFSGDAPPGSPVSGGSVRRRAAGFSAFASPGTPKRSKEKNRKGDGSDSSSSSSDSDSDSKQGTPKNSGEIFRIQEENKQLRMDLEKGFANHKALESRLTDLQEELKALQQQNVQLHRNAASAQSEIAALEAEIERLKRENFALGEEASSAARTAEKLQNELDISHDEQRQLSIRLDETDLCIQGLEAKIKELEVRILVQAQEKEVLKKEASSAVQTAEILQKEVDLSQAEQRRLSISVEESGFYIQGLENRIKEVEAGILQLTEQLSSSTASCERLEGELTVFREERDMLLRDVSAQSGRIVELEEENARLRASLTLAESERERHFELHQSLEKTLADVHIEFSSVREERGRLSEELLSRIRHAQSLEQQFNQVQEAQILEVQKLRALLGESEDLTKRLEAQILEIQEDLESGRLETDRLRNDLDDKVGRCNELEALCKSLQQQLAEHHAEKRRLEAQLSVIRKEALDEDEIVRLMQERVTSKQHEIDQVQSINEDLKEIMGKFESEIEGLKQQISSLQKQNTMLNEDVSTKASLIEELDQSFTDLKEEKVVFEEGFTLAVGNVGLVQAEVDKLLEKISKTRELSLTTGENLQKMEDRICKLQVSNLTLRDEISGLAKKEKSYVIAVRFMRAEFFCLVQRIKAMKEEKMELSRLGELAMEAERKKNGEALSSFQQELAFLREENKRQRGIIFDRAEEKREAIRQLCTTIDYMQNKNRRLEGAINSVREKIERRIAASSARRN